MTTKCKSIGCTNNSVSIHDFCHDCLENHTIERGHPLETKPEKESMVRKYPQYYKAVGTMTEVDVYAIHHLFGIQDPSGAIQHASKKLLLSGVRTGEKSAYQDVKEARDTLTRWLQLNTVAE